MHKDTSDHGIEIEELPLWCTVVNRIERKDGKGCLKKEAGWTTIRNAKSEESKQSDCLVEDSDGVEPEVGVGEGLCEEDGGADAVCGGSDALVAAEVERESV